MPAASGGNGGSGGSGSGGSGGSGPSGGYGGYGPVGPGGGVNVPGGPSGGAGFVPTAIAGFMPFESASPVRYWNGAVVLTETDLTVAGGGFFGHERFYNNQTSSSYDGPNGWNWFVTQMPYITASGTSIAVVFDPNNPYWFDASGSSFVPRYGMIDVSLTQDTTAHTVTFTMTDNGQLKVAVFNSLSATAAPGGLISYTDANGLTSSVTSLSGNLITEIQRIYSLGGVTILDSLLYTYFTAGSASGKLQTATYRQQTGGGSWVPIRQVLFGYYGSSDANGSVNDLQSATQQLPDGTGGWNPVAVKYYRYWLAGASTGFAHGLKMHFGPEAYRLIYNAGIDIETASDATLLPYADHYFEYNPTTQQVTKEISAVCSSCHGGGTTSDLFAYTANPRSPTPGYNVWSVKTVQTLPDSSTITVYTNYAGMTMLYVRTDSTGARGWITFYLYDTNGHLIWTASPSAVNGYDDSYDDLLNYDSGTSLYQYLNDSTGLINVTHYYSSTGSGGVAGYPSDDKVQEGQSGTPVLLKSMTYTSNTDSDSNTIYPVAAEVSYPDASDTSIAITTSYSYTFYSGTNVLQQKTVTLPAISSGQNGDGSTPTTVTEYDAIGNLTQFTDERGIVNTYSYSILGLLSEQVLNYQSGVTQPGVNVTTDFAYDAQGRLIQTTGPAHTIVLSGSATSVQAVTWNVYVQSVQPISGTWDVDQTWTGKGCVVSGPTYTLIDPVTIAKTDKDGRSTDQITSHRTSGSGALSPSDTFAQTDWQSWSSTQYDDQHRTLSERTYFLIPSSGTGTAGTNYGQTTYGYDALERRNRVVAPGGTITRTVWTAPQQVASVWVGTNDTGATDSNPAGTGGSNNMVVVTANVWDNGVAGGDRNLTQVIQYASTSHLDADLRITAFGYDFRDRRTSMTDAMVGYTAYSYDNLDRQTMVQRYASPGGNLIAQNATNYDDRGRVYQRIVYAVDLTTGTVGNSLVGNSWYDYSGNVLQQIEPGDGQVFTKNTYNGVGWVTAAYTGYNPSGTSYSQATTVTNDIILEQAQNTFDEVGSVVSVASFQRLNDAPSSGSGSTGALSYGTQPKARVSYAASWFDGIDRSIASANYGAIASFTRPSTPPSSSSTVLVSSTSYNEAGEPSQTTDPMGYVTQTSYDAAGRKTQVIEDYGTGLLNRTTNWTYTLDNLIATMTAANSTTGDQTTSYAYGSTTGFSGVARKDLLVSITYPDSVSGSDVVAYTYNRQGQPVNITDQRGTMRTLLYDLLGRIAYDGVTFLGSSTDSTVMGIGTTYEARGMVQSVTSYDNPTPGAGNVLNQCLMAYNSFGQLIEEQQNHSGAVKVSTPGVQYAYDSGTSNSNEIRLNGLVYPNGRVLTYNFASGMDSALNRVTSISDTSATLASYTYLGVGTVVRITYPQPEAWLDLWGGTSGTFAGLDQFNRITDQRWQNGITGTPADIDRYQYGYDLNSNRQYKGNVVGTPIVSGGLDEFYPYDHLNRLVEMQRGTLNGTNTGITGTPTVEQTWSLDPTGNWSGFVTAASGTTDLNQTRTSNTVNEITNITESTGPTWVVPAYDPAGNTTTMPQVVDPTQGFAAVYDAWNRLISISDAGTSETVAIYSYDGRNRRNYKITYSGGVPVEGRIFYFTDNWQDIEERVGASTSMDKQYVWGIRYIDELVCRDDATPERLYACQDANFNVTAISDTSGAAQERDLYDPYGSVTVMTASWSVLSSSAKAWRVNHQGLLQDVESSLVYNRNRMLHPGAGAFTTRDPARIPALLRGRVGRQSRTAGAPDVNLYIYGADSPISKLDASGLDFPGCDSPATGLPNNLPPLAGPSCYLNCCAMHDFCYFLNGCTQSSWFMPWTACGGCNTIVVDCFEDCFLQNQPAAKMPGLYFCSQGPNKGTFYNKWADIPCSCWGTSPKPSKPSSWP